MATYGVSTYGLTDSLTIAEIKNLALFELGFPDDIDFTDLTNSIVEKVNKVYPTVLAYVLSNYPWRFVIKRTELTDQSEATDSFKYKYNYVLPAQILALQNVYYDSGYCSAMREYESSLTYINTDATKIYISYKSAVDESALPKYFIDYFKYRLAMELCFNFTGDTQLLQILAAQEQKMLIKARNTDAMQSPPRTIRSSPFTQQIRG